MEIKLKIFSVVILNNLLTRLVVCREDVFVLDPKCQQIKELYSNESCALLNIPHHIRTSQTQICTFKYKFKGLKKLKASLENKLTENCFFDIKLGSGITDTPIKMITCHDNRDSHILWPWSAVYLFVTFKENDNENSNKFISIDLCASNTNIKLDSSRTNKNTNNVEQKPSYNETMHKIVSPLVAFLTVGIIACLVFCVRYQGQYGFMRGATSQQSINQSSFEVDNGVNAAETAYSISESDFMNGIPSYYYYVYQMNKSLHPFPKEPPPSYSEVLAGPTYPDENPPPYDVALGLIAQQSRTDTET